ncbi:hypothetical protein [Nocardioides sp. SYSU D00038]|uniref:hypothetical protein n=1 Tax=Nocardioides sp. SYSU D00038 TaxID=2812554 RepID=UPI001967B776|nr:hypothetical protein [Nocardioides sp. SYSU D00038]
MLPSPRLLARAATAVALLVTGLVTGLACPALADSVRVTDPDPYESYFLGARSATFTNGARKVVVRADHSALRWDTVDVVRVELLVGRLRKGQLPRYATAYHAVWRVGSGLRLERQSPGQELPVRVRCRGLGLRHDADPARLVVTVPTRCLRVPKPSRPYLARGGGNDVRFSYLVHNLGGNVTETVPGTQGQGEYSSDFTRWVDR